MASGWAASKGSSRSTAPGLGATFAASGGRLRSRGFGRASSSLCFRRGGCWSGGGIELRLGVAHGLRQHRTELVLGWNLRSNERFLCAHSLKVRNEILNLKVAVLGLYFNDERLGLLKADPAWPLVSGTEAISDC